jgi:hypothetical protein
MFDISDVSVAGCTTYCLWVTVFHYTHFFFSVLLVATVSLTTQKTAQYHDESPENRSSTNSRNVMYRNYISTMDNVQQSNQCYKPLGNQNEPVWD